MDVDGDGAFEVADAIAILNALFAGGALSCLDAADTDDDGVLGLEDAIFTLGYLFLNDAGAYRPRHPYLCCGFDPTWDRLDEAAGGEGCRVSCR